MPRCFVYALPFALVLLAPALSYAAGADCPDGWFCEPTADADPEPSEPAPSPGSPPPGPSTGPRPASGSPPGYPAPGYPAPPGDPNQAALSLQVPPPKPPAKRRRRGFREWGFNLHLEGARLGNDLKGAEGRWLGGLGFGFRYRPIPALAFEAGVDLLKGTDHQGYTRNEAALLLNMLAFFNPRDVVQVYALGGLGFSGAKVSIESRSGGTPFKRHEEHYSYFGGQLGLGVEVRVSRRVAIAGDLLGFIRGRTDEHRDEFPEIVDSNTENISNRSGGGLLRAGVTFYW